MLLQHERERLSWEFLFYMCFPLLQNLKSGFAVKLEKYEDCNTSEMCITFCLVVVYFVIFLLVLPSFGLS